MIPSLPVFESLQSHHDRKGFDCGNTTLNQFLQRQARQNADRNLGVTHVAVECAGASKILAYYNMVTRTVAADIVPERNLPNGDIGVVLLGRLAVDRSAQGRGIGRLCLLRAISQVERASHEIGIYALVLDAIDNKARDWYLGLNFGFKTLLDDQQHLYIATETIRQLG